MISSIRVCARRAELDGRGRRTNCLGWKISKSALPDQRGTVRAVDGISFTVREGEAVGIVGESGSGKSMAALALLRLVPEPGRIVGGRILFAVATFCQSTSRLSAAVRRSEIAMIFQDAGSYLNPIMTISDQIAEAVGRRDDREDADRSRAGARRLARRADCRSGPCLCELSPRVERRHAAAGYDRFRPHPQIATDHCRRTDNRARCDRTIPDPEVDRGASGTQLNASLILISHDLAVVSEICDRVYVMYAGQIVEEGMTERLFDDPKHPYTKALVDAILDPFEPRAKLIPLEGSPPDMADPPSGCRFHPRCRNVFEPCDRAEPPSVKFSGGQNAKCWLHADSEALSDAD